MSKLYISAKKALGARDKLIFLGATETLAVLSARDGRREGTIISPVPYACVRPPVLLHMNRRLRWLLVVALIALMVAGLVFWMQARRAPPDSARPAAPAADAIVLELMAADILTASVTPLARTIPVSGTVRAVQSAVVKARVPGEVVQIAVREGEQVRRGQVLVRQDTTELDLRLRQAQQQVASAQAQQETASRALANNRALVDQGFISPTALETSLHNETAARAALTVAQAATDLARKALADATLRSPIDGWVSQRLMQPGERAPVDARILELVDLSRMEIDVALPAEDVAGVQAGRPATLQVDGVDGEITARVARINPSAQAGSRAVAVYLVIEGQPGLRHGLFARGRVLLEERSALTVPPSAVRNDRPLPYVRVLEGNRIIARTVRIGVRGASGGQDAVEILEGLVEGERLLAGTVGTVGDGVSWRPSPTAGSSSAPLGSAPPPATALPAAATR
jgi:RND family efflux transporter MFP subunit